MDVEMIKRKRRADFALHEVLDAHISFALVLSRQILGRQTLVFY